MTRELAESILDAVSNDFESYETIVNHVTEVAKGAYDPAAIGSALEALMRDGKIEAYRLSPTEPHSCPLEVTYPFPEDVWFLVKSNRRITSDDGRQ